MWLFHKTTRRAPYERRRERRPDVDDVLLVNDRGEVTESTIANLAVRLEGEWVHAADRRRPAPRHLPDRAASARAGSPSDPSRSTSSAAPSELALVSSVRGWRTAVAGAVTDDVHTVHLGAVHPRPRRGDRGRAREGRDRVVVQDAGVLQPDLGAERPPVRRPRAARRGAGDRGPRRWPRVSPRARAPRRARRRGASGPRRGGRRTAGTAAGSRRRAPRARRTGTALRRISGVPTSGGMQVRCFLWGSGSEGIVGTVSEALDETLSLGRKPPRICGRASVGKARTGAYAASISLRLLRLPREMYVWTGSCCQHRSHRL